MELKHYNLKRERLNTSGFNRTFMELKPDKVLDTLGKIVRFNRTFMELKPASNLEGLLS